MFRAVVAGVLVLFVAMLSSAAFSQAADSTAPIPPQITSAKKVFIGNSGGDAYSAVFFGRERDYSYERFYSAMKNWGKAELVSTPSEADLVLEIAFRVVWTGGRVISGDTVGPGFDAQLRLEFLDPKTHVTLWALTDHVPPAILESNRKKNLESSLNQLLQETQSIMSGQTVK